LYQGSYYVYPNVLAQPYLKHVCDLSRVIRIMYDIMKDECYEFLKNDFGKVEIVGFGSYGEVKLARNTENG
jgi:hypothetical protein